MGRLCIWKGYSSESQVFYSMSTCSYLVVCLFHWSGPKSAFPICWWKWNVGEAAIRVLSSGLVPAYNKENYRLPS